MKKVKISTPEEVLNLFLKWFDNKKRLAFITAFIIGFITHINMITDSIMSQDGLWNSMQYFKPGDWEITLGRWGIVLMQRLNNFIAIPNLTTISCIFIMSVISVFIIDLFDLKSKISIIITSIALVITPTFLVTLLYVYTSLSYCMCMFLSVLSIWSMYKIKNKKLSYVLISIFFILTMSIYQSYIGVTIGLFIMLSIINLLDKKENIKEIVLDILRIFILLFISGILYLGITKLILLIFSLSLSEYKSANSFSIFNIILNLKKSIISAYKDFASFFIGDRIVYNTNYRRELLYVIFFLSTGFITIKKLCNINFETKKEKMLNICFIFILVLILPIALNVIDIIIVESELYALTAGQLILVIPFCLKLIENTNELKIVSWFAIISVFGVLTTYYISDNTSYTALKLTYNQAYSTTERLIDRIENTPGYNKEYPIIFGGIVGNNNFPRTSNLYNYTIGSMVNNTVFHGTYGGQIGTWVSFIKLFFGMDVVPCEANLYYSIVTSEEYEKMDIFPAQNSIKIRDGLIIVKLSNEPPLPF